MSKPAAIANKFLELARAENITLTNMQLQKLPFIANGYHLAIFDRPLIDEDARVWTYGPVYRTLYDALRRYGSGPVTEPIRENDDNIFADERGRVVKSQFSIDENRLMETVWNAFKTYSGAKLSALTHLPDSPWAVTKDFSGPNSIIPEIIIKNYYKRMLETSEAGS